MTIKYVPTVAIFQGLLSIKFKNFISICHTNTKNSSWKVPRDNAFQLVGFWRAEELEKSSVLYFIYVKQRSA